MTNTPTTRCPTCGRPVASMFDHVDVACEEIDEDLSDRAFEMALAEMRSRPELMET